MDWGFLKKFCLVVGLIASLIANYTFMFNEEESPSTPITPKTYEYFEDKLGVFRIKYPVLLAGITPFQPKNGRFLGLFIGKAVLEEEMSEFSSVLANIDYFWDYFFRNNPMTFVIIVISKEKPTFF